MPALSSVSGELVSSRLPALCSSDSLVNKHIDPPPLLHNLLNNLPTLGNIRIIGNGLAHALIVDLFDDLVGRLLAEIVDQDLGATRAEERAVGFAEPSAGAGDDDDLVLEGELLSEEGSGRGLASDLRWPSRPGK